MHGASGRLSRAHTAAQRAGYSKDKESVAPIPYGASSIVKRSWVLALLRIAVVWNIPIACNRASADFVITSELMTSPYRAGRPDYEAYMSRRLETKRKAEVDTEGDSRR